MSKNVGLSPQKTPKVTSSVLCTPVCSHNWHANRPDPVPIWYHTYLALDRASPLRRCTSSLAQAGPS